MIIKRSITLITVKKPESPDINDMLQWLGVSLGLFGVRDRDKSCFRIFIELLKRAKLGQVTTSDDLAQTLSLTRGTVVHHLHNLMSAGLVTREPTGYILKVDNLHDLIDMLQHDINKNLDRLKESAIIIDKQLGLNS